MTRSKRPAGHPLKKTASSRPRRPRAPHPDAVAAAWAKVSEQILAIKGKSRPSRCPCGSW